MGTRPMWDKAKGLLVPTGLLILQQQQQLIICQCLEAFLIDCYVLRCARAGFLPPPPFALWDLKQGQGRSFAWSDFAIWSESSDQLNIK